jgi:hypothetical protein
MPPLGVVAMSCEGDLVSFVLQRADGPDFAVGPLDRPYLRNYMRESMRRRRAAAKGRP